MRLLNIYVSEDDVVFLIKAAKSHSQQMVEHLESELIFAKSQQTLQGETETLPKSEKLTTFYAPFGFKKDGSPAKRRGRPSTKKVKA